MIQPDLGFEFETGWRVERQVEGGLFSGSKLVPLKKYDVVEHGDGFRLEADTFQDPGKPEASELEFVIHPPVTEDLFGELRLSRALSGITAIASRLEIRGSGGQPFPLRREGVDYVITPTQDGKIAANPQVTAGVRLDRIGKMVQDIGDPRDLFQEAPARLQQYEQQARHAVSHLGGSEALVGFVTLVFQYLRNWEADEYQRGRYESALDYAKDGLYLLARTNFAAMYRNVGPEMATWFPTPGDWAQFILHATGLDPYAEVVERGVRVPDGKPPTFDHPIGTGKIQYLGVKRGEWLVGMAKGIDLLSGKVNPLAESMGALGKKMDLTRLAQRVPILELRKNRTNLHHSEWPDFARNAFRYFSALNASEDQQTVHYSTQSAPLISLPTEPYVPNFEPLPPPPPPVPIFAPYVSPQEHALHGPGGLFEL